MNNERLEFLGDGVLNFIIASQLYLAFHQRDQRGIGSLRGGWFNRGHVAAAARD
jgi:ribonuclease-3